MAKQDRNYTKNYEVLWKYEPLQDDDGLLEKIYKILLDEEDSHETKETINSAAGH